jgi:hypothetical protein
MTMRGVLADASTFRERSGCRPLRACMETSMHPIRTRVPPVTDAASRRIESGAIHAYLEVYALLSRSVSSNARISPSSAQHGVDERHAARRDGAHR